MADIILERKRMSMDVSVIIVSWNTKEILRNCLRSVYEQVGGIRFEVFVVDNASSDGSAQMVEDEYPQVRLIRNAENRGFAAANNQAITLATGRYLLVLNPDTIVLDGAIAKTVAFADEHPEAGVIGCKILGSDRTLQRSCFMYHSLLNLLILTSGLHRVFPGSCFFGRERMTWWDYRSVREVQALTGCFMLVRREAISQVGLMDERFFMYAEEMDWCWRMRSNGWKVLYFPHAEIVHLGGSSAALRWEDMLIEQRKSLLLFIEKRQGGVAKWFANVLLLLGTIIRLCYWSCSLPLHSRNVASKLKKRIKLGLSTVKFHLGFAKKTSLRENR